MEQNMSPIQAPYLIPSDWKPHTARSAWIVTLSVVQPGNSRNNPCNGNKKSSQFPLEVNCQV